MYETDQEQLAAVLAGLSTPHQEIMRNALAGVEPAVVRDWLKAGALREWITQSVRLLGGKKGSGEVQLSALFAATPTMLTILAPGEIDEWLRMGLDIALADSQVFVRPPEGVENLSSAERFNFYRLVRSSAYRSPRVAMALYRSLPNTLRLLPPDVRSVLLRCLQAAATFDPEPLPTVLPFLTPTLRSLSPEGQTSLLDRVVQLANTFPAGVARLFRSLARAYEEVGEEGVKAWIAAGEAIAQKNSRAGEAFFALESRTSLLMLRGESPGVKLQDMYGVLLKYLHMLCGAPLSIKEIGFLSFPPPLAEMSGDILPLPAYVEVFPTYEENVRLYRVLAAQHAGRVAFGTHADVVSQVWPLLPAFVHKLAGQEVQPPDDLAAYFELFPQSEQIEALFLYIESRRVAARLAETYRGLREDLAWAASLTQLLPPVLSSALPRLPSLLWRDLGREATVYDSLLLATELHVWLIAPDLQRSSPLRSVTHQENAETLEQDDGALPIEDESEGGQEPSSLSAEEREMLRKIMAAVRAHKGTQGRTRRTAKTVVTLGVDGQGDEGQEDSSPEKKGAAKRRARAVTELCYLYDEWDYLIEDYRTHWCQLREAPLTGDDGAFFSRTLATYEDLTQEIKREFQRLRPRLYRRIKGLEDGDEIDLDASVAARVDRRNGAPPSPKLYVARQPLERDVAALFLMDLSASTDAPLAGRDGVRVIDVVKEAVVLLSAALETIGDAYAIYGFSSHGRRNVEVYPVKTFAESLSLEVKGRIGGLAPQRSTRMGTAVRHAVRKLRDLSSRAKFLVLLSDGHPEDADYGPGQHSPTYGVRDTMMALREAEQHGVMAFCLTIDKAGRDYLREMCAPSRYMIIEDPTSLPAELPKIYQRHIRLQRE